MNKKLNIINKGFTLIELIVVVGVFLVVISASIAIFFSIVTGQSTLLIKQEIINQMSYSTEYISKGMRMAKKDLSGDCLGSDYAGYDYLLTHHNAETGNYEGIKFINQSDSNACTEFYLQNSNGNSVLKEIKNGGTAISLTSEKLYLESVRFILNGNKNLIGVSENDQMQPRITIYFKIRSKNQAQNLSQEIQTTISQRNLNVK